MKSITILSVFFLSLLAKGFADGWDIIDVRHNLSVVRQILEHLKKDIFPQINRHFNGTAYQALPYLKSVDLFVIKTVILLQLKNNPIFKLFKLILGSSR